MHKVISRIFAIFLATIISLGCPLSVSAITPTQRREFGQNNIIFYNPTGTGGGSSYITIPGTCTTVSVETSSSLPSTTIQFIEVQNVKDLATQNMARYTYAANATNLPWQALAAIHFREASMNPNRSMTNGEELTDHINIDGVHISSDPNEDALTAANILKNNVKEVYGINLTASSSLAEWGIAFLAYNRGAMYKNAYDAGYPDSTWNHSPYAMAGYDSDHPIEMLWLYADSYDVKNNIKYNNLQGTPNGQAGALAVMTYLDGFGSSTSGGTTEVCTPPTTISGLTDSEAQSIVNFYKSSSVSASEWNLPYGKWNCVSLVAWYVQYFTGVKYPGPWGNGRDVVTNLKNNQTLRQHNINITTGSEPRPLAVFSITDGVTMCGDALCGHTGVVLAVNGDNITVMEAYYGSTGVTNVAHYSRSDFVNTKYGPNGTFAYLDQYVDVDKLQAIISK
ncbi:CHAP domain-containing protein [Candidatus Saccharibacteria bacterium]|nr:CHAP domain-containing protein [Candidatus Saccharibacteria bacterium]